MEGVREGGEAIFKMESIPIYIYTQYLRWNKYRSRHKTEIQA